MGLLPTDHLAHDHGLASATGVLRLAPPRPAEAVVEGLGFRPRAVLFWWSLQAASGTALGNRGGIGLADDTGREAAVAWAADDEAAVGVMSQWGDECAVLGYDAPDARDAALRGGVVWRDDGFVLASTDGIRHAWQVHYLALGGTAVDGAAVRVAHVHDDRVELDQLPFSPDFVLFVPGAGAGSGPSPGLAVGVGVASVDAQATSEFVASVGDGAVRTRGVQRHDAVVALPDARGDGFELAALVRAVARKGEPVLDASEARHLPQPIALLAIRGVTCRIGTGFSPNDPGTTRIGSLGFQPVALLTFTLGLGTSDRVRDIGRLSLGAACSPEAQHNLTWAVRNRNAWPPEPRSRSTHDSLIDVVDTWGGDPHAVARLTELHRDGFSLDWPVSDNRREYVYVALGAASRPGLRSERPPRFGRRGGH